MRALSHLTAVALLLLSTILIQLATNFKRHLIILKLYYHSLQIKNSLNCSCKVFCNFFIFLFFLSRVRFPESPEPT